MSVLVMRPEEEAAITAAVDRARTHIIPLEHVQAMASNVESGKLPLTARKAGGVKRPRSEMVELPVNFRCAISFEEQPVGLCKHLSISLREGRRGVLPSPQAASQIARAFGFSADLCDFLISPRKDSPMTATIWREEFEPGCWSINIVEPDTQVVGHA